METGPVREEARRTYHALDINAERGVGFITITIHLNLHISRVQRSYFIHRLCLPTPRWIAVQRRSLVRSKFCLPGCCPSQRDGEEGCYRTRVVSGFVCDVWSGRCLERTQVPGGLVANFHAVLEKVYRQRRSRSEDRETEGKLPAQSRSTLRIQDRATERRLAICCCGSWFEGERSRLSPTSQPFWVCASRPSNFRFSFDDYTQYGYRWPWLGNRKRR